MRRTKIVCTLGPACADEAVLGRMIAAGVDVAGLNFSHGTHESHGTMLDRLRRAAAAAGRTVGVLQDLCGPKIRVGQLPPEGVLLAGGAEVRLACGAAAAAPAPGDVPVEYEALPADVRPGDRILFDDGALEARVVAVDGDVVRVLVVHGGTLKSRKGLNLPGVRVSAPSVTAKDLDDLEWGLASGVDAVALSFVRCAADLDPVRARLAREAHPPLLVAKLETPEAVEDLDAILAATGAVMVARGDLGVEVDFERVPRLQKRIIRRANERDVPVITATQMLESMCQAPRPTRAEASDVANAVLDGTDAVMLSGETASGIHPVEAVDAMARIAAETEAWAAERDAGAFAPRDAPQTSLHDALALAAERVARNLAVRAVVVATRGGDTARCVASARLRVPVLALSPEPRTLGRCALLWGLKPVACPPFAAPGDDVRHADDAARAAGLGPGDTYVLLSGRGPSGDGSASLRIRTMGG